LVVTGWDRGVYSLGWDKICTQLAGCVGLKEEDRKEGKKTIWWA